jgi:tetratricopeptide (TPR) repeat protein
VQGAIASWQTALSAYQSTNNFANQAIVREKLAIAYRQIGQFEQAINYWKQAIANSRKLGDFQKVGRLLTELAQTYSQLGLSSSSDREALFESSLRDASRTSVSADCALLKARTFPTHHQFPIR